MSASRKYLAPVLSRATSWSIERIGALTSPEVKLLRANAERLEEPEIVAICEKVLTQQRREAIVARKALPPKKKKPKPVAIPE